VYGPFSQSPPLGRINAIILCGAYKLVNTSSEPQQAGRRSRILFPHPEKPFVTASGAAEQSGNIHLSTKIPASLSLIIQCRTKA
jgi:hypothetical protein